MVFNFSKKNSPFQHKFTKTPVPINTPSRIKSRQNFSHFWLRSPIKAHIGIYHQKNYTKTKSQMKGIHLGWNNYLQTLRIQLQLGWKVIAIVFFILRISKSSIIRQIVKGQTAPRMWTLLDEIIVAIVFFILCNSIILRYNPIISYDAHLKWGSRLSLRRIP